MKQTKKAITFVLVLCMMLSMVSVAFAANTLPPYDSSWTAITTAEELKNIQSNGKYYLANDIDLSGQNWVPLPDFRGKLDGCGYTIKSLTINDSSLINAGLFSNLLSGAWVGNMEFTDVSITALDTIGTVAGESYGTIERVFVTRGTITANNGLHPGTVHGAGGIVGYNIGRGCVKLCKTKLDNIKADYYAGGIVGYQGGSTITSVASESNINIDATNTTNRQHAGGIAGYVNNSYIRDIYVRDCVVTGNKYVGGIVGNTGSGGGIMRGYVENVNLRYPGKSYFGYGSGQRYNNMEDIILVTASGTIPQGENLNGIDRNKPFTRQGLALEVIDGAVGEIKWDNENIWTVINGRADLFGLETCKHTVTKIVDKVEATCTQGGKTGKTVCANCGFEFIASTDISALGHDWDEGVIDPEATCIHTGVKTYTCKRDNTHTNTEIVPVAPNNHVGETYITGAVDSDCINKGSTGDTYCSDCNAKLLASTEISELGHNMGTWYVVTAATCTTKGTEKRDCQRTGCDYSETKEIAIDSNNHKAEDFYTVDTKASCTADGSKSHHCERCDAILDSVVIAKRDHSYDAGVETLAPTCTEAGVKTFTCQNTANNEYEACTHSYTDAIPALNHDWDDGVIDPNATCKHTGVITYTCKRDSSHKYTDTVAIDPDNHVGETYIKDATDPDCTNEGYTGDTYCKDCDAKLTTGTVIPALNHDMGTWYVAIAATCTEKGTEQRDCQRTGCDYSETNEIAIDSNNHKAEDFYTVDTKASCTADGSKSHHCERCDAILDSVVIAKRDHSYDAGVVTLAPTCTVDGVKTFTCQNTATNEYEACAHTYTDAIPALNHDWDDGVIDPNATCKHTGVITYTCKRDSSHKYTDTVAIDPDNHVGETYIKNATDPDCTNDGYTGDKYCKDCDAKLTTGTVIPALNHDMGTWYVAIAATCTEKGTEQRDCQRTGCDYSETREIAIDSNNHKAEDFYTVDTKASCTEDGSKSHHCERCDAILDSVVIAKRDHSYDAGVETLAPTCTEAGVKTFTCQNTATNEYEACTHSYTDAIPALNHDWDDGVIDPNATCKHTGVITYTCKRDSSHKYTDTVAIDPDNHVGETYIKDATDPDCTNDGYTGDKYCKDCDAKLTTGTVIPALNHDMGTWYVVTAATCTTKGTEKCDCQRTGCDYSETREIAIDSNNHKAEDFYTVDTKASCTADGSKSHHCERCDAILDSVVIAKRDHSYDAGVETLAPTCTEAGVKTFTCQNTANNEYEACTHSYTDAIPALDHDWDDGVIDPNATCKHTGVITYTCKRDSSHKYTDTVAIDPDNHVGETYIKNATDPDCTNEGYTGDTYCKDCDAKLADGTVITNLGHNMGEWYVEIAATCTAKGTEKRDCQRTACDYSETRDIPLADHKDEDGDYHCDECGEELCDHATTILVEAKAATCTEDGYTGDLKCATCGDILSTGTVITKLGHDMGEWYEFKVVTCTEIGIDRRDCQRDGCDYYETKEYDAIGHYDEDNDEHCDSCGKDLGSSGDSCIDSATDSIKGNLFQEIFRIFIKVFIDLFRDMFPKFSC